MSSPQTIDIFSVNSDWEQVRLRYVALLNPGKSEVGHVSEDTAVSFIPMEEVEEDGTFNGSDEKLLGEVYSGYTYFRDGDVLVAKITPCFENGKGALVDDLTNGLGFGSTEFHVLRASKQIEPRFLFYLTRTHPFRDVGAAMMTGAAGQKRVPDDFLANLMIPCPSRPTQLRVANFLDEKTAQIDELIAKKERLIELLEEKRAALINRAVTKGLNPDVPMKDSGIPWIGEIPEHWDVTKLKFIAANLQGRLVVQPHLYFTNSDDGVPIVFGYNIRRGKIEQDGLDYITHEADHRHKHARVRAGDLLTVRVGEPGMTAVVPESLDGCHFASTMWIHQSDRFSSDWLSHSMNSNLIQHQIDLVNYGAAQTQFNIGDAKNFLLPFPPLHEQQKIAAYISREIERLDAGSATVEKQLRVIRDYRQSLITAAVTGQIDVTEESTDISEQELAGAMA